MAYVPGYATDIFISYTHSDNRDGWVTDFKSKLANGLADLSADVDVWFDADRLRTGDRFSKEIEDKLSNTRILVAVVSPAYLNSEYCMDRELIWFQDSFGLEIIQYLKVPLESDQDPPLKDVQFKRFHDSQGCPLTDAVLKDTLNPEIWLLRGKLEAARKSCRKVYLAGVKLETLRPRREALKRLLHQSERLAVLPAEVITPRTDKNRILKLMGDCELSIHFDDTSDPLYLTQRQAAQDAGKPIMSFNPRQSAEEIERTVKQELLSLRRQRQLYLIYDPSTDGGNVESLARYFSQTHDCKVLEPQAGESYHRARLDESDGIVFFHRNAPETWLEKHREVLIQGAALRQTPRPEAWYFLRPGEPSHLQVERDLRRPQWTITRTGDLDLTDLRPFSEVFDASPAASA